ncbi:MAG TPA: hybrid sensor histidine kinase/response regulator [Pyrinomonadaceae bacterium]|jgi:chemosensory pili system protein ChpA (sensor histidine kinase/response regulator)
MENETLQNFINETEIYLPMIRSGILVCSQEGNSAGELETSLLYTRAIKDAARAVGLENIGKACEKLELELKNLTGSFAPLLHAQTRGLLDNLAYVEALLAKLHFSSDDFSLNFDGFVDESFLNLGFDSIETELLDIPDENIAKMPAENEPAGFEIDAEMLEIFAEEAEDLLRNINSHLEVLKSAPNDRESLLEIRRSAHTLKGSAGIVGLKPLSGLAHRVEDLLDYLAEKQIDGNRKIFELLSSSTDCLSTLANGETSVQLGKKIELLYRTFDETFHALENGTFEKEAVKIPALVKSENMPEVSAGNENQPVAVIHKSVVRVSLEKLDELVRLVGDLVISRSVFEQRLAEFERQINQLQNSTARLTRSTGKLETDFEASLLNADFGMRNADLTNNRKPYMIDKGSNEFANPQSAVRNPHSFDSLEFDRYTEFHQTTRELLETAGDASAINTELDKLRGNLEMLFGSQSHLIEEMHDKLLRLRMVRFGSLASRLQRTVRVTCEQEQKYVELVIEGEQTEVDTQILDLLVEPLLHLLRNAVAHGIEAPDTRRLLGKPEKGKINLRLHSEGTHIILTVTDDGRGISAIALREKAVRNGFISEDEASRLNDEEAFSLGFLPGLTTAESVSQTAGRGVGMNIIKTSILRGQGTISVASEPQKGATFTIRMPMALAITRGLLVKTNGQTFAFPLKIVKKVSEISMEEFARLTDKSTIQIDGTAFAVSNLGTLLDLPPATATPAREFIPLLLLETAETPRALMVDEIVRAEEIVIKPLSAPLQNYPNLLGATILGDGGVVPVLDLIYLLKNQVPGPKPPVTSPQIVEDEPLPMQSENSQLPPLNSQLLKVMVVDDSPSVRHITSKLITNAGWEVVLAKDGLEALEALEAAEMLPDIVLTDVEMPRMDGYELLSSIRNHAHLCGIPVIMITSRASEKHHQKAVELGVSEYLTKPFDDSVLIEKIKILSGR